VGYGCLGKSGWFESLIIFTLTVPPFGSWKHVPSQAELTSSFEFTTGLTTLLCVVRG